MNTCYFSYINLSESGPAPKQRKTKGIEDDNQMSQRVKEIMRLKQIAKSTSVNKKKKNKVKEAEVTSMFFVFLIYCYGLLS